MSSVRLRLAPPGRTRGPGYDQRLPLRAVIVIWLGLDGLRHGAEARRDRTEIARRRSATGIDIVKEEYVRPVHRL